ncbi:MAG TPA: hypothetical protein VGN16_23670 [Acidobacteriaceae bacterium]|jgi:hypothetical protein
MPTIASEVRLALFILGSGLWATALAQSPREIYEAIAVTPSAVHWCLPAAGDDPAGIIESRCHVYSDCLTVAGLPANLDDSPSIILSNEQRDHARVCHQSLFNAARMNPQIKGAKATQQWLQHHVIRGTEAKSFPIPASLDNPR